MVGTEGVFIVVSWTHSTEIILCGDLTIIILVSDCLVSSLPMFPLLLSIGKHGHWAHGCPYY